MLVLALVLGVRWWAPGEQSARLSGPQRSAAPADPADDRDARAAALVETLEETLLAGRPARAATLAGDEPRAARELRDLVVAARQVGLATVDLRYVAATGATQDQVDDGADRFGVDVELTWQVRGFDDVPSSVDVPVVLRDDGTRTWFVTARERPADRAPIWFNDAVDVRRPSPDLLVVRSRSSTTPVDRIAREGVRTVQDALPRWDGRAVVEVPGSVARFARATGLATSSARGLAAVTTSSAVVDLEGGPERVVLNESVYGPLGAVGQSIVMSHELTHVAVGAASSAMPLWLSEGYADYVALRRSDISVDVLAAQIRELVRREGPPRALPGPDEFDGANPDVGAWYESSWLAARLIAQRYGEQALDDFYQQADRDGGTDRAFRELGTSERAFTKAWSAELDTLSR
ncbi:hypothetical protein G7072_06700 [Nocardioides sp. HDW12B]|uniref:hypothetical protein n=1 Tax=Nocardioides sp. HDW12B TaxID=2714939 RepID=UPI0014076B4E|nr:hypothetical protein [Nocardioides sp. HDW12B]QIK66070.1 hypothetical protein G7072_06700 [Nocardioides sp. HDW12B]